MIRGGVFVAVPGVEMAPTVVSTVSSRVDETGADELADTPMRAGWGLCLRLSLDEERR